MYEAMPDCFQLVIQVSHPTFYNMSHAENRSIEIKFMIIMLMNSGLSFQHLMPRSNVLHNVHIIIGIPFHNHPSPPTLYTLVYSVGGEGWLWKGQGV